MPSIATLFVILIPLCLSAFFLYRVLPTESRDASYYVLGTFIAVVLSQWRRPLNALDSAVKRFLPASKARNHKQIPDRTFTTWVTITFTLLTLGSFFFDSYQNFVLWLKAKGDLAFPNDAGFTHLAVYGAGLMLLPLIVCLFSVFGFRAGLNQQKMPYLKVTSGILMGAVLAVVFLSVVRGEWAGPANYDQMAKANPGQLPQSKALGLALLTTFYLVIFSAIGFYVWLVNRVGFWLGGLAGGSPHSPRHKR
jgi:hypothetical protein